MDLSASNIIRKEWRAHEDLTSRAKGGIVIYFTTWLLLSYWGGLFSSSPVFFYTNTLIFISIAILRLIHYRRLKSDPKFNTPSMYTWLVSLILISALHWGVITAVIVYYYENPTLYYPLIIILSAFAMGGTAVLSISRIIGFAFPFFVYGPLFTVGFFQGNEESLMLNALALISLLYIIVASKVSHNDYWSAIHSQEMAEQKARQLKKLSVTDQLTQLKNRMHFEGEYLKEWQRCIRNDKAISVFMIDLDHFKNINDSHGHAAGDECLVKVSAVLQSHFKHNTDLVARYGGEEFVAMMVNADLATIENLAHDINNSIAAIEMKWKETVVPVSCSIGIACIVPSVHSNRDALLMAADNELYRAKENGRNQYYISSESIDAFEAA